MAYHSLRHCINDLERHGHLVRIRKEVDPFLEMAAIHRRVCEAGGPAILYENIRGCQFPAVSNIFGTPERCRFLFRNTLEKVKKILELKNRPWRAIRHPLLFTSLIHALPKKVSFCPSLHSQTTVDRLPQIQCWPSDGGPYILLPEVYTEDAERPGVMHSNLGCYRIQMSGNQYRVNEEVGLHYQIHRGIGVHQAKANGRGEALRVSVFVGGPPSHIFAAVMPLPKGVPEVIFAGLLGGRRFRYARKEDFLISADADFVLTGTVEPHQNKPEGPFGDHLGYYSLEHDFPVMKIHRLYHRRDAIWPFTVVGRPPQEDTHFGALVHELAGDVLPAEIPGLLQVHAVDAAGVHPLLLAVGSERYTPYDTRRRPAELLTIANHLLGTGQLSLAKYLFIAAREDNPSLDVHAVPEFFTHLLERADWTRDLHFHTRTTMDTLDYSGTGLNSGSKVVIAAAGEKRRELGKEIPAAFSLPSGFSEPSIAMPGVLALSGKREEAVGVLCRHLAEKHPALEREFPLLVIADESRFATESLRNFLWVTFTKSDPAQDVHGVEEFIEHKHWGCRGALIIDARSKPHHAPPLVPDAQVEKRVEHFAEKGMPLHGIL